MHFISISLFAIILNSAGSVHIVWDNNADTDYNNIDYARNNEVRMPNWFLIYPGTKWCGAGNVAENYDDLGDFARTDKCCREHDNCNDYIEGYQSGHNLTNQAFYSKLNCACDNVFYQCLKSISTTDARIIGNIYFNALGTKCFKYEYPIKRCTKHTFFPTKKCLKYELEETAEKIYQWFDIPQF